MMFSFDQSHPRYPDATIVAKCLVCYTDVFYYEGVARQYYQEEFVNPTARLCKCKAVGCAVDDDGTFNLFVDDIRKVHLGHYVFNKERKLVRTEWWNVSGSFLYVDYNLGTMKFREIEDTATCEAKLEDTQQDKPDDEPKAKHSTKQRVNKATHRNRRIDNDLVQALDTHVDFQSRLFYYTNNWKVE